MKLNSLSTRRGKLTFNTLQMVGMILNAIHALIYWILQVSAWPKCNNYPHVTDQDSGLKRSSISPEIGIQISNQEMDSKPALLCHIASQFSENWCKFITRSIFQ